MRMLNPWRVVFYGLILSVSLISISCARPAVEKAFKGRLPFAENNKVITNYCRGCHVHKNQPPSDHIPVQTQRYQREPYRSTTECRVCHYLDKDFWGRVTQKTHFPRT